MKGGGEEVGGVQEGPFKGAEKRSRRYEVEAEKTRSRNIGESRTY